MQEHAHWNAWRLPWFRWRPAALWNFSGSPLVLRDKKSEAIPAFCHWRCGQTPPPAPSVFTEFLRTPADCIVEFCLFLNKWVYDGDFLLPLPSLSLIWNSTHPSERGCCLCLLSPCAKPDWQREEGGGAAGAHPPYEKPRGHTHVD